MSDEDIEEIITDPLRLAEQIDGEIFWRDRSQFTGDGYPVNPLELHRDEWALVVAALRAMRC